MKMDLQYLSLSFFIISIKTQLITLDAKYCWARFRMEKSTLLPSIYNRREAPRKSFVGLFPCATSTAMNLAAKPFMHVREGTRKYFDTRK